MPNARHSGAPPEDDPAPPGAGLDPAALARTLRERWPIVAGVVGACLLAALVYALAARPLYTAATTILIDTRKNQLLPGQGVVGEPQVDAGMVESQVEILRSEGTALAVVRRLGLAGDPAFGAPGGWWSRALGSLLGGGDASGADAERRAAGVLLAGLSVRRVGLTYVIEVGYSAPDPTTAARVANAVADAYLVGELDAKYQATRRAGAWLRERIGELRQQAQTAEQAVERFKADNAIVGTNRGLMADQQLGDVNAQTVSARAATAEAKARLDRVTEIARQDLPDATVTDALRNDVITRLRTQSLELAAREADWAQRYGRQHAAVQNLRGQIREIRASIAEELRRIAETYKSDYEIARARERSITDSLARLVEQATATAQAQVTLRDLDSAAQSARGLYDTFLRRSLEAAQQQTFPITDARIITVAAAPRRRSAPRVGLAFLSAGVVGAFAGVAAALAAARLDRSFRTTADLEDAVGRPALGIVPEAPPEGGRRADVVRRLRRAPPAAPGPRSTRYAVDDAFSRGAETLRRVKAAVDGLGPARVIGITSALPREGKTRVAAGLAQMIAHAGRPTVLVDADLRNPGLSRVLAPAVAGGLAAVLAGAADEVRATWTDPVTGLHVLPCDPRARTAHTAELLHGRAMGDLLGRLRERYAYVLLDLPPVLPVVDVRAAARHVDGFVFVVAWGRTDRGVVAEALDSEEALRARLLGLVLNRAPPRALGRYEASRGASYGDYFA